MTSRRNPRLRRRPEVCECTSHPDTGWNEYRYSEYAADGTPVFISPFVTEFMGGDRRKIINPEWLEAKHTLCAILKDPHGRLVRCRHLLDLPPGVIAEIMAETRRLRNNNQI